MRWVMNGQECNLVVDGVASREGRLHSGNLHFERMEKCHQVGNAETNGAYQQRW